MNSHRGVKSTCSARRDQDVNMEPPAPPCPGLLGARNCQQPSSKDSRASWVLGPRGEGQLSGYYPLADCQAPVSE